MTSKVWSILYLEEYSLVNTKYLISYLLKWKHDTIKHEENIFTYQWMAVTDNSSEKILD